MASYKIQEDKKNIIVRNHLKTILPLFILADLSGMAIAGISLYTRGYSSIQMLLVVLAVTLILISATAYFSLRRGLKRFKKNLDVQYHIGDNHFSLHLDDKEIISIPKEDIQKITQYNNGFIELSIKTQPKQIVINNHVEYYDEVLSGLNALAPLTKTDKKKNNVPAVLAGIGMLVLMFLFYHGTNIYLVLSSGLLILVFLLLSLISIVRNKTVDKKTKIHCLVILVVIIMFAMRLVNVFRILL